MRDRLQRQALGWGSALAIGLAATPASAGFSGVSDDRIIRSSFDDPFFSQQLSDTPSAPFGAFDAQVYAGGAYLARQTSEAITSNRMAATGFADGFSEMGSAESIFEITFDVDTATEYRFSGTLTEDDIYQSDATAMLLAGTTTVFSSDAMFGATDFLHTGIFTPGQYTVLVKAIWLDNTENLHTPARFSFELVAVPEPGTASLVTLGLLGCAARRRSRLRSVAASAFSPQRQPADSEPDQQRGVWLRNELQ